jgi:hypothetical protein
MGGAGRRVDVARRQQLDAIQVGIGAKGKARVG